MADETIKLKNPETAALYEVHAATTYDFWIMSPGLYKGRLERSAAQCGEDSSGRSKVLAADPESSNGAAQPIN
jgi:hypothetical protein